jgi:hypothetical protein
MDTESDRHGNDVSEYLHAAMGQLQSSKSSTILPTRALQSFCSAAATTAVAPTSSPRHTYHTPKLTSFKE